MCGVQTFHQKWWSSSGNAYFYNNDLEKQMLNFCRKWERYNKPPAVIVAGSGLQSIKTSNASLAVLEEYTVNLTRLVQPIDALQKRKTKVLWALLVPVNTEKLKPEFQMISNSQIDLYNKAAIEVRFTFFWVASRHQRCEGQN